jgi:sensor domain CHASE-containing protein
MKNGTKSIIAASVFSVLFATTVHASPSSYDQSINGLQTQIETKNNNINSLTQLIKNAFTNIQNLKHELKNSLISTPIGYV